MALPMSWLGCLKEAMRLFQAALGRTIRTLARTSSVSKSPQSEYVVKLVTPSLSRPTLVFCFDSFPQHYDP